MMKTTGINTEQNLSRSMTAFWTLMEKHGITPTMLPIQVKLSDTGQYAGKLLGTNNPEWTPEIHQIRISNHDDYHKRNSEEFILTTLIHEAGHTMVRIAEREGMHNFLELIQGVPWKEDESSEDDAPMGEDTEEEERVCEALALHFTDILPRQHHWPEELLRAFSTEYNQLLE